MKETLKIIESGELPNSCYWGTWLLAYSIYEMVRNFLWRQTKKMSQISEIYFFFNKIYENI